MTLWPISPTHWPPHLAITSLFSVSISCFFVNLHIREIILYLSFWLISLSIIPQRVFTLKGKAIPLRSNTWQYLMNVIHFSNSLFHWVNICHSASQSYTQRLWKLYIQASLAKQKIFFQLFCLTLLLNFVLYLSLSPS